MKQLNLFNLNIKNQFIKYKTQKQELLVCSFDYSVLLKCTFNYGNLEQNENEHYLCLLCNRKFDII